MNSDCLDTGQPNLQEYYLKPIPTVWTVITQLVVHRPLIPR